MASSEQGRNRLAMIPKTLGVQALLLAALPANLAVTAGALAYVRADPPGAGRGRPARARS